MLLYHYSVDSYRGAFFNDVFFERIVQFKASEIRELSEGCGGGDL